MNAHSPAPHTAHAHPHIDSWYAASAQPFPPQPTLQGETEADVCIIGAGMTGCSAAIDLARAGFRVTVLDARRVGWGASGRSGGQFIADYACGYSTLESLLGRDAARQHFELSKDAIHLLKQRIAEHDIACDIREGYCTTAIKPRQQRALLQAQDELARHYDHHTDYWDADALRQRLDSPRYIAGLFDAFSGHLHPLNYTLGLARAALGAGARIFEDSAATRVERGDGHGPVVVHTANGTVKAKFLLLAGNAYLGRLAPELDRKIMPVGTYIMATEPLGAERAQSLIKNDMAVCDSNFVLDYFRLSADTRLLFGGRVSYSKLEPLNLTQRLYAHMTRVFPQLTGVKPAYTWGGFVDITMNRAPHFGRLQGNILFAQGFSGHGVALTGMAGRLMADAVRGQAERFDVFSKIPHHDFPGGTLLRTPALVLAMAYFRLRDWL